jgi:hypothetical protein
MLKPDSRTIRAVAVLVLLMPMTAATAQAQETLLGAHGGRQQTGTPGAISTVNQSNANTRLIGTPVSGLGLTGIATNSINRVFASTADNNFTPYANPYLIEIDPATGTLVNEIGPLLDPSGRTCWVGDLSFQPGTDVLYGILAGQSEGGCTWQGSLDTGGVLVTIDTSTGTLTMVGRDPSLGHSNGGLAFRPNGTLFFTPCRDDDELLLTLDPDTANILTSRNLASDTCYMGLAARPSDGTLFASYNWESNWDPYVLVTLNPNNGNATLIGHTYTTGILHDLTFTSLIEVGFEINAGMSDAWFNAATSGQGFLVTVFEDAGLVFLAWFTFDTERPPGSAMANLGEAGHRWVTAQGPYDGDTAELTAYLSEGGVFDSASPAVSPAEEIGTITIVWHDCENGTLTYDLDPPGVSGTIAITRIAPDNAKYCEAYQP